MNGSFKRSAGNRPSADRLTALVAGKASAAKAARSSVSLETQRAIQAAISVILGCDVHVRSIRCLTEPRSSESWAYADALEKLTHTQGAKFAPSEIWPEDSSEESTVEDPDRC